MLKNRNEIFTTRFHRIIYCIPPENHHRKIDFIKKLKEYVNNIEIILGLPSESDVLQDELPKLIILGTLLAVAEFLLIVYFLKQKFIMKSIFLDDLMDDVLKSPFVYKMFTEYNHHSYNSLVYTSQHYFTKGETSKGIRENCNYQVFFRDPVKIQTMRSISCQLM